MHHITATPMTDVKLYQYDLKSSDFIGFVVLSSTGQFYACTTAGCFVAVFIHIGDIREFILSIDELYLAAKLSGAIASQETNDICLTFSRRILSPLKVAIMNELYKKK
jgi:hypothetical protein